MMEASDALTWIEQHVPDGIRLVAQAMSGGPTCNDRSYAGTTCEGMPGHAGPHFSSTRHRWERVRPAPVLVVTMTPCSCGTDVAKLAEVFLVEVRENEREACAKLCDETAEKATAAGARERDHDAQWELGGQRKGADDCASAIRARGTP